MSARPHPLAMDAAPARPKMVFFQRRFDKTMPAFLQMHLQDHVRCLSHFFDLTVINRDCDFLEVCDLHQPDLVLFETGSNLSTSHALRIKNTRANPGLTRLGLFNTDGWCETRAGVLSEMSHWGIENFVSIAVTAAEHTPVIAQNLICWPNFIDASVHRDYDEGKSIPVLLTGAQAPQYPWRARIFKRVSERYPATLMKHPGYYQSSGRPMIQGESYARMISASVFVPTCGTVANEVVRKHLEIPACGACLITERSPNLLAAGFVDMENCVFADEDDVLDKLDHLQAHPDELRRITAAGHALVHGRHTMAHRDQVLQWWLLHRQLKAGERIVQPNPFEAPIIAAPARQDPAPVVIDSGGRHLALLAEGQELLESHRFDEAKAKFASVLEYMPLLPEAIFCFAVTELYRGQAQAAYKLLRETIEYTLVGYKALDPDPVEWAFYITSLMCLGRSGDAVRGARKFPHLHHPELERARWAAHAVAGRSMPPKRSDAQMAMRRSLHRIPERTMEDWTRELAMMLRACGQERGAQRVADALAKAPPLGRMAHAAAAHPARPHPLSALWRRLDDPVLAFRIQRKLRNARRRLQRLQQVFSPIEYHRGTPAQSNLAGEAMMSAVTAQPTMRVSTQPRCAACGGDGVPLYADLQDKLFGASGRWSLARCADAGCGLIWLDPMPLAEDLGSAYEGYYTRTPERADVHPGIAKRAYLALKDGYLNRRFGYRAGPDRKALRLLSYLFYLTPLRRQQIEEEVRYLPAVPKGRLLDVGCGSGAWLARMQQLGWETEGLDFDQHAVDVALAQGLNARSGPLRAQHYPESSFDVVVLNHVIEHVPDPAETLAECRRILKPGGRLLLFTPNGGSLGHRLFKQAWRGLEPPRHLHLFSFGAMKTMLVNTGFQRAEVRTVNSLYMWQQSLQLRRRSAARSSLRWPNGRGAATLLAILENLLLPHRPQSGECLAAVAIKR